MREAESDPVGHCFHEPAHLGLVHGAHARPFREQLLVGLHEGEGPTYHLAGVGMSLTRGEAETQKLMHVGVAPCNTLEQGGGAVHLRPAGTNDVATLFPVCFHNGLLSLGEETHALEEQGHSVQDVFLPLELAPEGVDDFLVGCLGRRAQPLRGGCPVAAAGWIRLSSAVRVHGSLSLNPRIPQFPLHAK